MSLISETFFNFFKLKKKIYWRIVYLQFCISFRCTATRFRFIYIKGFGHELWSFHQKIEKGGIPKGGCVGPEGGCWKMNKRRRDQGRSGDRELLVVSAWQGPLLSGKGHAFCPPAPPLLCSEMRPALQGFSRSGESGKLEKGRYCLPKPPGWYGAEGPLPSPCSCPTLWKCLGNASWSPAATGRWHSRSKRLGGLFPVLLNLPALHTHPHGLVRTALQDRKWGTCF